MNIKKIPFKMLFIAIVILIISIILYLHSTVTIKLIIPEDMISTFVYDTLEIHPDDYKTYIDKIEKMRFSRKKSDPQSKEMELYIYIKSIYGYEEIIGCNDDLITHTYNNEIIETYKIPLLTQYYLKTQVD